MKDWFTRFITNNQPLTVVNEINSQNELTELTTGKYTDPLILKTKDLTSLLAVSSQTDPLLSHPDTENMVHNNELETISVKSISSPSSTNFDSIVSNSGSVSIESSNVSSKLVHELTDQNKDSSFVSNTKIPVPLHIVSSVSAIPAMPECIESQGCFRFRLNCPLFPLTNSDGSLAFHCITRIKK